jgi:hypothetical protein
MKFASGGVWLRPKLVANGKLVDPVRSVPAGAGNRLVGLLLTVFNVVASVVVVVDEMQRFARPRVDCEDVRSSQILKRCEGSRQQLTASPIFPKDGNVVRQLALAVLHVKFSAVLGQESDD